MAGSLKRQRLLVAVGFIVVAVGFGGQIAAEYYNSDVAGWGSWLIFGTCYTVGYGLLAWAAWAWFTWIDNGSTHSNGIARMLRLFGVANLAFAFGLLVITYTLAEQDITLPYDGRLSIAVTTTFGLQLLGTCLVSVGFWSAAKVCGSDHSLDSISGQLADLDDH